MTAAAPARLSRRTAWCAAVLAALALLAPPVARAAGGAPGVTTVEVLANSAMHIVHGPAEALPYKLTIYRMDGLQLIEQSINQRLPQNEADARRWLEHNGERIRREVARPAIDAANGLALAQRYRIERLPAVIINRAVVVYGLADVDAAIAHYTAARSPAGAARP